MANFFQNGRAIMHEAAFRTAGRPTNYYVALVTAAIAPTFDMDTLSELTEIAAGNGYTSGGYQLTPGDTDFDVLTRDDVEVLYKQFIKDITWTASGGSIPASGDVHRYAVLTDDNATVADRRLMVWWDLGTMSPVSSGQDLTLSALEIDLGELA